MAGDRVLVVLIASDTKELRCFGCLQDVLAMAEVFLVIPDEDEETIAMAHRLHPRYLVCADGDLDDLLAVLQKKILRARSVHHRALDLRG